MKVSLDRLDKAIFNILRNEALIQSSGRPRACELAATHAWVHRLPENEDTKIVREQLVALRTRGWFNLATCEKED